MENEIQQPEHQVLNTISVQIQSVINVMSALGYVPDVGSKKLSFINQNSFRSPNLRVSFDTAVKLHNAELEDWAVLEGDQFVVNTKLALGLKWPTLTVLLSQASKLVEKVKMSVDKRGKLVFNSERAHYVKPCNQTIADLITR